MPKIIKLLFVIFIITMSQSALLASDSENLATKICETRTIHGGEDWSGTVYLRKDKFIEKFPTRIWVYQNNDEVNCAQFTKAQSIGGNKMARHYKVKVPAGVNFRLRIYTFEHLVINDSYNTDNCTRSNLGCIKDFISEWVNPDSNKILDGILKEILQNLKPESFLKAIHLLKILKKTAQTQEELNLIEEAQKQLRDLTISELKLTSQQITEQDRIWNNIEQIVQTKFSGDAVPEQQIPSFIESIKNDEVPLEVREDAINSVLKSNPSEVQKNEILGYFREKARNPQSELFVASLIGLFRIGEPSDRSLFDVGKTLVTDKNYTAGLLTALGNLNLDPSNRLREGSVVEQFEKVINEDDADLSLREIAIESLGNFVARNNSDAGQKLLVRTLKKKKLLRMKTLRTIVKEKLNKTLHNKVLKIENKVKAGN